MPILGFAPIRRLGRRILVLAILLSIDCAVASRQIWAGPPRDPVLITTIAVPGAGPLERHSVCDLALAIDRDGTLHVVWSGTIAGAGSDAAKATPGTFYQRSDSAGTDWTSPRLLVNRIRAGRILLQDDSVHVLVGPGSFESTSIRHFISRDGGTSWREADPLLSFRWTLVEGFDAVAIGDTILVASLSSRRFVRREYLDYPSPEGFALNLLRWTEEAGRDSVHVAWMPETIFSQAPPALAYGSGRLHLIAGSNRNRWPGTNVSSLFGELWYFESEDLGSTWSSGRYLEPQDSLTVSALGLLLPAERLVVISYAVGIDLYAPDDEGRWKHERVLTIPGGSTLGQRLSVSGSGETGTIVVSVEELLRGSTIEVRSIGYDKAAGSPRLSKGAIQLGASVRTGPGLASAAHGSEYYVLWRGFESGSGAPAEESERIFLSRIRLADVE